MINVSLKAGENLLKAGVKISQQQPVNLYVPQEHTFQTLYVTIHLFHTTFFAMAGRNHLLSYGICYIRKFVQLIP